MTTLALEPSSQGIFLRRLFFAVLVAATTVLISTWAFQVFRVNGLTPLKTLIFVLFVVLLLPIVLSFWTAVVGFFVQLRGGDTLELAGALKQPPSPNLHLPRSAVVMPIYNEDPARVFPGVKATFMSLDQTGLLSYFDFFILSDTTNPDIWVQEELAFAELRQEVRDPERLHYRNRRDNVEQKTGNIADFCATWGDRYRYMIVLDADSVMAGSSIVNLVRLMEYNPKVGIVQAPPLPVNRMTLFGRLHQFALHAYSRVFISGLNFWQGGAANYWGHNAIIRIAPFVEHCRLPKLSGKQPLGGSILSHDFVEAAFMRRAGWKVYLASELRGSYEEMPGSLIGYAARDRRWCQGNLQHSRLLFMPRFHLVNRVHMWMGIMSYAASPLWLLLLALTTIEGIWERLGRHAYFPGGDSLFPTWQLSVQRQALWLFLFMMSLLLIPKLLTLVILLRDPPRRAGFGGALKLIFSVLCESLASTLLAPNLALLQARFVVATLMGRNVKWEAQDRGETGTCLSEASRRHWPGTVLGVVWTILLLATVPRLFWWFSPVIAGFLLAIPISVWSSRTQPGRWAREHGLFLIPEELDPPEVLRCLHQAIQESFTRPWNLAGDGLARVLEDDQICEVHLSLLRIPSDAKDPLKQHHIEGLQLKVQCSGIQALTTAEKRELLLDPEAIRALKQKPHLAGTPCNVASEKTAVQSPTTLPTHPVFSPMLVSEAPHANPPDAPAQHPATPSISPPIL
ncbi:Glucans biosynthesis glucosyltransferase H [Verrucomicrobia bacterium]|nr:Glucans biosynthesis glucosyltransferase H [Verrucomicrobiota bacterium]